MTANIFLSTLSLRRATPAATFTILEFVFLSTLSLRRATVLRTSHSRNAGIFLSTLSLRRATVSPACLRASHTNFYPRSPCGERRGGFLYPYILPHFYPRSPCGERLSRQGANRTRQSISIHALLAESDRAVPTLQPWHAAISIHALLAESDTGAVPCGVGAPLISIHALLAESDQGTPVVTEEKFADFYPRSPCGERLHYDNYNLHCVEISIHALLAESDRRPAKSGLGRPIFLSTLSLRRATLGR